MSVDAERGTTEARSGQAGEAVLSSDFGWAVMWRVELSKLAAQLRVRVVMVACVVVPIVFVLAESVQTTVPSDTLFGRWVHESGFAVPLLILGYADLWALPFAIGIVAGDVFSEEDRYHTWSMLLTRSRSWVDIFVGKVLAAAIYTVALTLLLGVASTVTGVLAVGDQSLVGLSGTLLSPKNALFAVIGSWASELAPALAMTAVAILISVASRNSWVGMIGAVLTVLVLNLVSMLSAIDPIRPFLFTSGEEAWHGLPRSGVYTNQIWISVAVCAVWIAITLGAAGFIFLRRDVVDA